MTLDCGGEDAFADERIGGDSGESWDAKTTRFDVTYDVSESRTLTIWIEQLHNDRRYSQHFQRVGCVEIAQYPASDWRTVARE